ncbi:MAG: alpha/beta fold hydrolase [Flavobacteriales bacterium]|nr:alpha/beta fold hydrolase [Flavobacteriales bacterium]
MSQLANIAFEQYTTLSGEQMDLQLSYKLFGLPLGSAPVVLVNHSLTGDADVAGENGWWSELIGDGKVIDTDQYTILAFNFPGNGVDNNLIDNYEHLVLRDIAYLFKAALDELGIDKLYAAIGGSIGGALVWEMGASFPELIENLIPVACDWKTSSWVLANTLLQDRILHSSKNPLQDARIHAMMCYRTPESFKERFGRSIHEEKEIFNIDSWLLYHGEKLNNRFQLQSYKLMNHLLRTIDITEERGSFEEVASQIKGSIHLISIDTDLFFTDAENRETYSRLIERKVNLHYHTISSVHGHDAFLIEYDQLNSMLSPLFTNIYAHS